VRPVPDDAHDLVRARGFAAAPVAASRLGGFEFSGEFYQEFSLALTAGMAADDYLRVPDRIDNC
jgi:hypothetical protein